MSVITNDLQCTQSWTLTTEIETKIDACENDGSADCYELITNRITNREIRERTKMIQLSNRIRRMRMK